MAFATAKELLAARTAGRWAPIPGILRGNPLIDNLATAQAYIDQRLTNALNNRDFCKVDRPWKIVNLTKKLDPEQAWVGFEFETGFDKKVDHDKYINFLWNQEYTAIDREGSGKYPVEAAFAPQNIVDVLAGKSTLQQTVEFINDAGLDASTVPSTFTCRDIGIHAGISTPKSRAGCVAAQVRTLSNILFDLDNAQMRELYGRTALHWGTTKDRISYVELKMFKSVTDVDKIKGYIQVVAQCATLLDFLIDNPNVKKLKNTYAFLSGADEVPVPTENE